MTKLDELIFLKDTMEELIADPEIDFGPAYEMTKERKNKAVALLRKMIREERLFSLPVEHGGRIRG